MDHSPNRRSWSAATGFIEVKSLEEAIEWAKRSPLAPNGPDQETDIEVREFIPFE